MASEAGRLVLKDHLQGISNLLVYAAGDAAARGPMLTPVASLDARAVVANLQHGNCCTSDHTGVASVVFCEPPLARVGLSEAQARRSGLDVDVRCESTSDWFSARYHGEPCAGFKTLVERGSRRIVGAHLLGPAAEEVINLFALAVRHGLTVDQIQETALVFPTAAHDIKSML